MSFRFRLAEYRLIVYCGGMRARKESARPEPVQTELNGEIACRLVYRGSGRHSNGELGVRLEICAQRLNWASAQIPAG